MKPLRTLLLFTGALLLSASSLAQREPVMKQIDLPHAYYYREMYLPQLTTGPSGAAWLPDSQTLIYSMGGSLWRQDAGTKVAEQFTAGRGYDYQPDCSPDGRWIVFARYDHDAVELWSLDLQHRQYRQLTSNGAVNVEPRISPDGKQLAFVSSSYHGHFHIFVGRLDGGSLSGIAQLTPENTSPLPRYYYSKVDHEISPVWSPDGTEILFVSNRGHIHGTGGFWRMKAHPDAEMREIHYEETNWKARPEMSPDGKRLVYSSYLGRSWNQLWVMPSLGGDTFPISYGDYDNTNPRWSPDGSKIAFISNRNGNTSLWIQAIPGGGQTEVVPRDRKYLNPAGELRLRVIDPTGKEVDARIFLTGMDGRAYAPTNAWMMADDSFDRKERPFEAHYFDSAGTSEITLPAGKAHVGVMHGFEYQFEEADLEIEAGKTTEAKIQLRPVDWKKPANRWVSGDVHVHMNYGGSYRNTPSHLVEQAEAEDVSIIENLIVNKEQRFPDIAYFLPKLDAASNEHHLLQHAQEFHTSYWGHLGLLNLSQNLILPGYSAYPNTAAASLFPSNADVADMAHHQGALVGYVHPFDSEPDPAKEVVTNELPADVALGKVDYVEVLGFSDHKSTATVWYKLLNCGFRLPAAAGTDFMGNYASLRGPMGLNRVYASVPPGPLKIEPWLVSIKAGRTFATNGPLLSFDLGKQSPGGEIRLEKAQKIVFHATMGSMVPLDHVQIVCNGKVVDELKLSGDRRTADVEDELSLERSGWCLLRAFSDRAEYPILDAYPYATTSPVYVTIASAPSHSSEDAHYFLAWIDQLIAAAKNSTSWNSAAEQQSVLRNFAKAKERFEEIAKE